MHTSTHRKSHEFYRPPTTGLHVVPARPATVHSQLGRVCSHSTCSPLSLEHKHSRALHALLTQRLAAPRRAVPVSGPGL
jgi:hypothetical protein